MDYQVDEIMNYQVLFTYKEVIRVFKHLKR